MPTARGLEFFGAQNDADVDLFEAALSLAALDRPDADLARLRGDFAKLVAQGRALAGAATTAEAQALLLAQLLYAGADYRGDDETYEDPANANMISVMERRRGLPVALAILYVALARALGFTAEGLNVPAHLLIRVGGDKGVLQDPFAEGRIVSPQELSGRLARLGLGKGEKVTITVLSNRGMLVRLLNNIASRAEAANDMARACEMTARMTAVAPDNAGLWWERARLEQACGLLAAARTSLERMADLTPDSETRGRITDMLSALLRSLN
jgi:regulator of sirC expression with transglutaminase-like and TPR domain